MSVETMSDSPEDFSPAREGTKFVLGSTVKSALKWGVGLAVAGAAVMMLTGGLGFFGGPILGALGLGLGGAGVAASIVPLFLLGAKIGAVIGGISSLLHVGDHNKEAKKEMIDDYERGAIRHHKYDHGRSTSYTPDAGYEGNLPSMGRGAEREV